MISSQPSLGVVSGTTPTLDVKMQESDDDTTWTDIAGAIFTEVSAANQEQRIRFLHSKRYCRSYATIGGTNSPSFDAAVEVLAQAKYIGQGGGYDRSRAA